MIHRLGQVSQGAPIGGKAASLDRLIREGVLVPPGFVFDVSSSIAADRSTEAGLISKTLKSNLYAVRSSALNEDGTEQSLAGMFRSRIRVQPSQLEEAIEDVLRSMPEGQGAVIVQAWIEGMCSGIAFSKHPTKAFKDTTVIDAASGSGEGIVSGAKETQRAFSWKDRQLRPDSFCLDEDKTRQLGQTVRQIEELYGCPVDVEWTCDEDQLWILQARPITRLPGPDSLDAEEERCVYELCLEKQLHLDHSQVAESLPFPSQASLDLQKYLYRPGGPYAKASEEFRLHYDAAAAEAYFVTLFGRLYQRDQEPPIQTPNGVLSTLSRVSTWQKALREVPTDFYRRQPIQVAPEGSIEQLLRQIDDVGLWDARITLLTRLAVSLKRIGGLDIPQIWKHRHEWLLSRPTEVETADFELSAEPTRRARRNFSEPQHLVELYAILREDAKDELRPILAALHRHLSKRGPCGFDGRLDGDMSSAEDWNQRRRAAPEIELPQTIVWNDLFDLRHAIDTRESDASIGVGVSAGRVEAKKVVVLELPSDIPPDHVLVTQALTPDWFPYLETSKPAGIITETGSIMSHSAIQCRERALPAIFGVSGARKTYPTGTTVSFDGKSGKIRLG